MLHSTLADVLNSTKCHSNVTKWLPDGGKEKTLNKQYLLISTLEHNANCFGIASPNTSVHIWEIQLMNLNETRPAGHFQLLHFNFILLSKLFNFDFSKPFISWIFSEWAVQRTSFPLSAIENVNPTGKTECMHSLTQTTRRKVIHLIFYTLMHTIPEGKLLILNQWCIPNGHVTDCKQPAL